MWRHLRESRPGDRLGGAGTGADGRNERPPSCGNLISWPDRSPVGGRFAPPRICRRRCISVPCVTSVSPLSPSTCSSLPRATPPVVATPTGTACSRLATGVISLRGTSGRPLSPSPRRYGGGSSTASADRDRFDLPEGRGRSSTAAATPSSTGPTSSPISCPECRPKRADTSSRSPKWVSAPSGRTIRACATHQERASFQGSSQLSGPRHPMSPPPSPAGWTARLSTRWRSR